MAALLVVVGSAPAAGAEVAVQVVPAGKLWVPLAYSVSLVQGLTQAPLPALVLDDGANVLVQAPGSSAAMAVSTTCQFTWATGLALSGQLGTGATVVSTGPLPRVLLKEGHRVRTLTAGIGANSQYGAPRFVVAELTMNDRMPDWV